MAKSDPPAIHARRTAQQPPAEARAQNSWALRASTFPSATVLLRIVAAGLSFVVGVVNARILSVSDFGALNVLLAVTNIGIVVGLLGHEDLATRTVAIELARSNVERLDRYRARATRYMFLMSSVACCCGALAYHFRRYFDTPNAWVVIGAFATILLCSVRTRYAQSLVRGRNYPALAVVPDGIVKPATGVCFVIIFAMVAGKVLWVVSVALGAAAAVALGVAVALERKVVPFKSFVSKQRIDGSTFSPHIFCSSLLTVIGSQLALLLTGQLAGTRSAAFYATSDRIASATAIVSQALFLAIAPSISRLHTTGDSVALTSLLRRYTRRAAGVTGGMTLTIALLAAPILTVFGPAYTEARGALLLLLLGAFLSAAAGPTGMLLLMTKHEKLHARALGISLLCQLGLSALLIPKYGLLGAATATLLFTVLWNSLMLLAIWRRLGLRPLLAWA